MSACEKTTDLGRNREIEAGKPWKKFKIVQRIVGQSVPKNLNQEYRMHGEE